MAKYLIRLDDACETQEREKWNKIEKLLDKYGIKPLVGVIPHNEDLNLVKDNFDKTFWDRVKQWELKEWTICMHGYNHVYLSASGGLNPVQNRSEFAGVTLKIQREKIKKAYEIFKNKGITPKIFYAPSHTFDNNTLEALKIETDIRIISDTIALNCYKYNGIKFIPQQMGRCRKILIGVITFCYHPNLMSEDDFYNLEIFLKKNKKKFIKFQEISLEKLKLKSFKIFCLQKIYFIIRKIRVALKKKG